MEINKKLKGKERKSPKMMKYFEINCEKIAISNLQFKKIDDNKYLNIFTNDVITIDDTNNIKFRIIKYKIIFNLSKKTNNFAVKIKIEMDDSQYKEIFFQLSDFLNIFIQKINVDIIDNLIFIFDKLLNFEGIYDNLLSIENISDICFLIYNISNYEEKLEEEKNEKISIFIKKFVELFIVKISSIHREDIFSNILFYDIIDPVHKNKKPFFTELIIFHLNKEEILNQLKNIKIKLENINSLKNYDVKNIFSKYEFLNFLTE